LIVEKHGHFRDFFSERITFPILDVQGAPIGFSARKFLPETFGGKYINTIETELFKKSRTLFGLYYSRKRMAKERQAIIVEGQLDALRLLFHGFDYTVASLGTAFTESHASELLRLGVKRIFLLLDGDTAGVTAAVKIGHLFQKEGVEVLVCLLSSGEDPDSLLVEHGPHRIVDELLSAKNYLEFLYGHLASGVRLDIPAEKNQLLQQLVERIRDWNNPIMVHESLKKLAKIAQIPEELLGVQGSEKPLHAFQKPVSLQADLVDPDLILESDLLRWLMVCVKERKELMGISAKNIALHDFRMEIAKKIYAALLHDSEAFDLLSLAQDADDDEVSRFVHQIFSKKINREKVREQFIETIKRMKERNWLLEREEIKMKIHSGKATEHEVLDLVRKFDELKNRIPQVTT
jgi:DNA primase